MKAVFADFETDQTSGFKELGAVCDGEDSLGACFFQIGFILLVEVLSKVEDVGFIGLVGGIYRDYLEYFLAAFRVSFFNEGGEAFQCVLSDDADSDWGFFAPIPMNEVFES